MENRKHIHIIDGVITSSDLMHPFNDKNQNDLSNKEFYIETLLKDLDNEDVKYEDLSSGKKNLFKFNIYGKEFNIYIEHCDAGGKDVSFGKAEMKVGIPFANATFEQLVKKMENLLVMDVYFELKETPDGKLIPNKDKYCYQIVMPGEIYSSEVTYNILSNSKKANQSSRWVTLHDISKCIQTKETLVNKKENVWLVHPDNIKEFLLGVVYDDYRDQMKQSLTKVLELLYKKELSDEKKAKILQLRAQLRKEILNRKKCEIFECRCDAPECLVASHLWPVNSILSNSDISWEDKEKYVRDPSNAFLLCGTHDKLLDKFLITFDDTGKLICSKILKKSISSYHFGDLSKPVINITDSNLFYLKKHRELFQEHENTRVEIKL